MRLRQNKALNFALRLLTKKDRTEAELFERLQRKGFPETDIIETIKYLKQKGLIDDLKFVKAADKIAESRFLGVVGIKNYLMRKGIDKNLIQHIPEIDELSIAQKLLQKKRHFFKDISHDKKKAKIIGFLLRRGFSSDTVYKCLKLEQNRDNQSLENNF